MYLPRSRSSCNGFERLLDSEEELELKKEQIQRRVVASATSMLFLLVMVAANLLVGSSNNNETFGEATQNHEHTVPTPLSIVDPVTGKYVNSLENELYQELKNLEILEHRFLRKSAEGLPILMLDKELMTSLRQPLTLSWTLGEQSSSSESSTSSLVDSQDILALYCPPTADHGSFIEAATLEQVVATSSKHGTDESRDNGMNEWFIPSFPVTKHDSCEFRLFDRQDQNTLQLIATSPTLHLPAAGRTPTSLHLAFSENPSEMVIQFNTAEKGTPLAMFGTTLKNLKDNKVEGTSHTYTADDMCGAPANETEVGKFQDPGMIHVVRLTGLQPNQEYSYKVGLASGQGIVWSDVFAFISPPIVGPQEGSYSIVVYGDQGCPSKGWGPGGAWTSAMAAREEGIRAVHHFGDLSYAIGAAHVWDEWMHMIQSFAARVPLMVGVGNHEYDHMVGGARGKDPSGVLDENGFMPQWGNFGEDSGGECGVPTSKRFTMPATNNSNGVYWYSYDFASMHTIMLSSEHNMTKGSPQHEWILADLKSVNRTLTPWLVLELHRPLYQSEFFWTNNAVGVAMRYEIEDLLHEYKVDLVLAGHYHSYLRTCDGLYRSKCNNGGPMHICVGSAGAHLDAAMLYPNKWTETFIQQEWGYGRLTVANETAMLYEFVKAGTDDDPDSGTVRDEVWLIRDRT